MSAITKIEWTNRTWNPVRGCSRVSEGCRNCYAERVAARFSKPGMPYHGFAKVTAPRDSLDRVGGRRNGWTGAVALVESKLLEPLSWRKPQRVFVNSMSDLFHGSLPDSAIDEVFSVMALAEHHTFQVLTKRPKRMREYAARVAASKPHDAVNSAVFDAVNAVHGGFASWPLRNVWLGVSVEDQATADARIPILLDTPAALRFVSYEPALGPVEFQRDRGWLAPFQETTPLLHRSPRIDWLIVGGESGPKARPCDVRWIRDVVSQCLDARVPVFVKQLGSHPCAVGRASGHEIPGDWPDGTNFRERERRLGIAADMSPTFPSFIPQLRSRKGGDPSEWAEDLRVRQFPEVPR